jgi:hypothetical protein
MMICYTSIYRRNTMKTKKKSGKINTFDGWDFMELAIAWNLEDAYKEKVWVDHDDDGKLSKPTQPAGIHHNDDSRPIREFLEELCKKYFENHDATIFTKYAQDLRMFARKLSLCDSSYYAPLWRGLARIEDDFTIVRASILLLPCMWS